MQMLQVVKHFGDYRISALEDVHKSNYHFALICHDADLDLQTLSHIWMLEDFMESLHWLRCGFSTGLWIETQMSQSCVNAINYKNSKYLIYHHFVYLCWSVCNCNVYFCVFVILYYQQRECHLHLFPSQWIPCTVWSALNGTVQQWTTNSIEFHMIWSHGYFPSRWQIFFVMNWSYLRLREPAWKNICEKLSMNEFNWSKGLRKAPPIRFMIWAMHVTCRPHYHQKWLQQTFWQNGSWELFFFLLQVNITQVLFLELLAPRNCSTIDNLLFEEFPQSWVVTLWEWNVYRGACGCSMFTNLWA